MTDQTSTTLQKQTNRVWDEIWEKGDRMHKLAEVGVRQGDLATYSCLTWEELKEFQPPIAALIDQEIIKFVNKMNKVRGG